MAVKYTFLILAAIVFCGEAFACTPARIGGNISDAERQKQIVSPINPHLPSVKQVAKDRIQELILLSILASFKVDVRKINFDQPISAPPLCMDELDFLELALELEDALKINISDAEAYKFSRQGSLRALEQFLRTKTYK